MKTVLVLSSQTAASCVGATASAFCLGRMGVRTIVLPTTLLGRHPGWGEPGGGPVSEAHLSAMWSAVRAQGIHIDAVMTGYLGDEAHIDLAKAIIADVLSDNPDAIILVDPVMGDAKPGKEGALYIPRKRADKIARELVPLADILTPNLWELSYLTGNVITDHQSALIAAHSLEAKSVLVTSVPMEDGQLGALYTGPTGTHSIAHAHFETVPHGGGDSLAALFLGRKLLGETAEQALAHSVSSVFAILQTAVETGARELPLETHQELISRPPVLTTRSLKHD